MRQKGKDATRRGGMKLMWATEAQSYLQNLGHMVDIVSVLSQPRANEARGTFPPTPSASFGTCRQEDHTPGTLAHPAAGENPGAVTGLSPGARGFAQRVMSRESWGPGGRQDLLQPPPSTWRIPGGPGDSAV